MLVKFHAENGHSIEPRSYDDRREEEGESSSHEHHRQPSLAEWVANQRQAFHKGQFRSNRKKLLDKIDFVWKVDVYDSSASLHQQHFDEIWNDLSSSKKPMGTCRSRFDTSKTLSLRSG